MDCKIKNDIGTIYITEDVLLKVVGYAALESVRWKSNLAQVPR